MNIVHVVLNDAAISLANSQSFPRKESLIFSMRERQFGVVFNNPTGRRFATHESHPLWLPRYVPAQSTLAHIATAYSPARIAPFSTRGPATVTQFKVSSNNFHETFEAGRILVQSDAVFMPRSLSNAAVRMYGIQGFHSVRSHSEPMRSALNLQKPGAPRN